VGSEGRGIDEPDRTVRCDQPTAGEGPTRPSHRKQSNGGNNCERDPTTHVLDLPVEERRLVRRSEVFDRFLRGGQGAYAAPCFWIWMKQRVGMVKRGLASLEPRRYLTCPCVCRSCNECRKIRVPRRTRSLRQRGYPDNRDA